MPNIRLRVCAALSGEVIAEHEGFQSATPLKALRKYVARHLKCSHSHLRLFHGEHELLVDRRPWDHGLRLEGVVNLGCLRDESPVSRHHFANAVYKSGASLHRASDELRSDRAIVRIALEKSVQNLRHVSDELRADEAFMTTVFTSSEHSDNELLKAIPYVSPSLMLRRDFVLKLVRRCGIFLADASPELRGDREIVLAAVGSSPGAFQFAAKALTDDPDVVLAAIAGGHGQAFAFAGPSAWSDRGLVLEAIRQGCVNVRRASEAIRRDRAVLLELMRRGGSLRQAPLDLQSDREIALAAVAASGDRELRQVPYPLCCDDELRSTAALAEGARNKIVKNQCPCLPVHY